jgi:hypothetical protein
VSGTLMPPSHVSSNLCALGLEMSKSCFTLEKVLTSRQSLEIHFDVLLDNRSSDHVFTVCMQCDCKQSPGRVNRFRLRMHGIRNNWARDTVGTSDLAVWEFFVSQVFLTAMLCFVKSSNQLPFVARPSWLQPSMLKPVCPRTVRLDAPQYAVYRHVKDRSFVTGREAP